MKKIKIIALVIAIILSLTACGNGGLLSKNCEKCEKIAEMQAEIEKLSEPPADKKEAALHEGSAEEYLNEERLVSLEEQIAILVQHDCPNPPDKVTNAEFSIDSYNGTYTGEMKAGIPLGKGRFDGVYYENEKATLVIEGNFIGSKLDGEGMKLKKNDAIGAELLLEGEFDNDRLVNGTKRSKNTSVTLEYKGEFRNNEFYNGEYTEIAPDGTIKDYGTYENGKVTYSALAEARRQQAEQAEKELEKKKGEFISGIIDWIL